MLAVAVAEAAAADDKMPLSLALARTLSHIWPAQFCVHVLMNLEVHE